MYRYLPLARHISKRPTTTYPSLRMSSTTTDNSQVASSTETKSQQAPLAIEGPSTDSDRTTQITVDGEAVKLDAMGPMVINADGTISRINNWHEMTEHEQATTKRLLVKRNEMRRKILLEKGVVAGQTISD